MGKWRTYHKSSLSEKIKAINNKIEQNKAQYKLDRHIAKTSALSSRNVGKYEFVTGEEILPEDELLLKASTIKIFEYLPSNSELISQT